MSTKLENGAGEVVVVIPDEHDKALAKLREPFAPEQIGKIPKAGIHLDYVGHAVVTARLLDVDPGWTWEPFARDEQGSPALDSEGNLWIRLTILGVTRPGVGDGPTMKERIGDAIRNASMRFGVALELWAKEDLHARTPEPWMGWPSRADGEAAHTEFTNLMLSLPEERRTTIKAHPAYSWPMERSELETLTAEAEKLRGPASA